MKNLIALITLLFLMAGATLIFNGCSILKIDSKDFNAVIKEVAFSVAAKSLGERLSNAGYVKWSDTEEGFYKYVQEKGLSIDSASIALNYAESNIPKLYKSDFNKLMSSAGFKISAKGFDVGEDNLGNLMILIEGFREGVLYAQSK